jgi:hypothetical protein
MTATRSMRIGLVFFVLFIASVFFLMLGGFISSHFVNISLTGMRHFLVMLGVPVAAVLLAEMPIRDGIAHRTLLYPLLGPVSRATLAIVRVLTTGAMLALASSFLLVLIRVLLRDGFELLPREILSVSLGAFAYVGLFGLAHLYYRRGLIVGLVFLFLYDFPVGTIPFSIRNLSPSYHMGVIANQQDTMDLPVRFGEPATSIVASGVFLVVLAVVAVAAVTFAFRRKNLGDLC